MTNRQKIGEALQRIERRFSALAGCLELDMQLGPATTHGTTCADCGLCDGAGSARSIAIVAH